ncbi:interleukin-6 receptor subunit beta isoform X1 [Oncorhynchus tshawytscha]|uniref:interleukin-6 receptor subunit beta isoform X1 n=1 Tax=Oncorhynchus tshawytscha TaxID=74940 RepID=UPI000D09AF65|nr:interleukin-6 receptor subunit beta isoform X1 [Oncorhynchus tshawytscha]
METKEHWFLQGFLLLAMVIAQGATIKCPSSHLCYKKTESATIYTCEWETSESMKNATYELFYSRSNSAASRTSLGSSRKSYICVQDNTVLNKVLVDIWVVAYMGNESCQSPNTTVTLSERVKYEAPQRMSMARSSSNLTLSWDNKKDAVIEVKFRRLEETSWTWKTFKKEVKQAMVTLENLQNESVYQLQVRQMSKHVKHPLWSDWTPILDVPTEIPNPPEVNWTVEDFNNGTRLLKLTWGTPSYPVSMQVNYNLSLHIWPCLLKRKNFTIVTTTEFSVYVTYSAVSGDIIAFNKVGKSSPTYILVPAKHISFPCKSWPNDRLIPLKYAHGFMKSCLEWYKATDGETRPEKVNRSKLNGTVKKKLKHVRKKMDDYVRYYYLVHKQTDGKPQSTETCLMYKKEGAPSKAPDHFTAPLLNVTTNSAMLHWKPIPVPDQRGFLTHYEICYTRRSQNNESQIESECLKSFASKTEYLVQNLTPGSIYNIHLAGATAAGSGPTTTIEITTKPLPQSVIGWIIAGIIALLITVCLFIIKRHKKKIFPPIPRPVVVESVNYRARNQSMHEKEEVHELQLYDNCSQDPNPEEATVLEVSETYECEDTDEKCLGDSSTPVSDPLSPDYKTQVLRLETPDSSKGEIDCLVTMLMYRNGLVFDMKAYSTEDVGIPL